MLIKTTIPGTNVKKSPPREHSPVYGCLHEPTQPLHSNGVYQGEESPLPHTRAREDLHRAAEYADHGTGI